MILLSRVGYRIVGLILLITLCFYQCTEEAEVTPDPTEEKEASTPDASTPDTTQGESEPGDNNQEPSDAPDNPSPSPTPNLTAREQVVRDYEENYMAADAFLRDWTGAVEQCDAGFLPNDVYTKALQQINYYRRQVGLNDNITLDEEKNRKCQQAALMMMANSDLDHSPPKDWKCYSEEGAQAAGKSNLGHGYRSARAAIDGYMKDAGIKNLGHRRWIIYSRAQEFGFGATSNYNALWVIGGDGDNPEAKQLEYIPWPPAGHVIDRLVFPTWSFSIPKANFSESKVTLTGPNGEIKLDDYLPQKGFGDNTIAWNPGEGEIKSEKGKDFNYQVTVSKVKIDDAFKDFTYEVIIIGY